MKWVVGLLLLVGLGAGAVWLLNPGEPEPGGGALRMLRGGAEVEISGPLSLELAAALTRIKPPHIVQLDSASGSRAGALALAAAIRAAGSETAVTDRCLSVCVAAFMAGRRRWLGPFATVGLDAGSSVVYRQAGVPGALVTEASAAPPDQTWLPTQAEVLQSGLATDRAGPEQFALGGFGPAPTPSSIRERLLGVPLYGAVAMADPGGFASTLDLWISTVLDGEPGSAAFESMQALLSRSFSAALLHADDTLLLAHAALFREELAWMLVHQPALCSRWAQAQGGRPGPTDADLMRRRQAIELAVLGASQASHMAHDAFTAEPDDCAHLQGIWQDAAGSAEKIRALLKR